MLVRLFFLIVYITSFAIHLSAQSLPYTLIPLTSLDQFRPTGTNWKIVKDVFYDYKKGGKGKTFAGTGVLVNELSGKSKDHLFTKMEHGDIEVELDFMMDKGSNSGIYLQGRYEIQMLDSWGQKNPRVTDNGAISQRWDESRPEGQKGYQGHPPLQNLSKAPGLWQHFKINFRAPRFNAKGEKTENARFIKVVLNGVTIHENIELLGPTLAAPFGDEKPLGPLMIQGDQGTVAIRNIRYKVYETKPIKLDDLLLSTYEGKFESLSDIYAAIPSDQYKIEVLAHSTSGSNENFGGRISGEIDLPSTGTYFFKLNLDWIPSEVDPKNPNGAGELIIGGKNILLIDGKNGGSAIATVDLKEGKHLFELTYFKKFKLWYARSNDITLSVEGPGIPYSDLNAVIPQIDPVGEITLLAENKPIMQRSFLMHKEKKKTKVISVGEPGLANYSYDLQTGSLLLIWRGDFLETTPMWSGRGETQLSIPLGSTIEFSGKPALALLENKNTIWPDSNSTYNYLGYDIDENNCTVFNYSVAGMKVKESLTAEEDGKKLIRLIVVEKGNEKNQVWFRLAEGKKIEKLPNGAYAVDDKSYYIEIGEKEKPIVREGQDGLCELLIQSDSKNNSTSLQYSIIW